MADGFTIDTSELRALAAKLTDSTRGVERDVRQVVSKGALNIRTQLRDEMGASPSFGALAGGITYDLTGNAFFSEAQIGPVKKKGSGTGGIGKGANIAYFGGSNGGGGTVPDPRGALERETPKFEKALGDILGGLL